VQAEVVRDVLLAGARIERTAAEQVDVAVGGIERVVDRDLDAGAGDDARR
jgi:hypothetical protein